MLYISNSFQYEIRPGSTYYWLRRKKTGYISNEIMATEEHLLAEGNIIIVNPYPISLKASTSGFNSSQISHMSFWETPFLFYREEPVGRTNVKIRNM